MLQTTLTFLVGALFRSHLHRSALSNSFRVHGRDAADWRLSAGEQGGVRPPRVRGVTCWGMSRSGSDDIAVFHYPVDHSLHLVKRVIAIPGDRLRLHHGRVLIDEQPQKEPFALYTPSYPNDFRDEFPEPNYTDPGVTTRWWTEMKQDVRDGDMLVPPGEYFVMGDNRNDSLDSRYWGFVPRQNIVGEPFLVYFSVIAPGRSEITGLSSDRLAHEHSWWSTLAGSARWDRIFHVIR